MDRTLTWPHCFFACTHKRRGNNANTNQQQVEVFVSLEMNINVPFLGRLLGMDAGEDMEREFVMESIEEAIWENEQEEARRRRSKLLLQFALEYLQQRGRGRSGQFRDLLNIEGMWRRDRRIPRIGSLEPQASPWQKLYISYNDQALITAMGFDHASFATLLSKFEPYFHAYSPWTGKNDGSTVVKVKKKDPTKPRRGRPRKIDAKACLGLQLAWFRFRGPEFTLQGWFGLTGTPANVWLKFGRRVSLHMLWKNELARVRMPSDEKVAELQAIVKAKHSALENVFCIADGLKLHFESADGILDEQNMCCNGWQCSHYITNLFVFSIDGRIIDAVVNAPGSIHDSTLAEWGDVCDKLERIHERTGGVCCLDSAFAASNAPYLLKSAQDWNGGKDADDVIVLRQATSLRQAAEWGMHAIQGSFPRLKDTIRYEDDAKERKIYLLLVCFLYNLRLELVGLNQIRNVYVPEWSKDFEFVINEF